MSNPDNLFGFIYLKGLVWSRGLPAGETPSVWPLAFPSPAAADAPPRTSPPPAPQAQERDTIHKEATPLKVKGTGDMTEDEGELFNVESTHPFTLSER